MIKNNPPKINKQKAKNDISLSKPKVLVILGPTASGKTRLAINLARKFKGEIISADSRQVFRGMDIGTGKDLKEYGRGNNKVTYHLIDVLNPNDDFNLAKYQKLANLAIKEIITSGHLPILVGGSGLYLQAVVDGYELVPYEPDFKERSELEKKSVPELYKLLEEEKSDFAHKLNNSDKNNPRRLVRYLEIINQEKKTLVSGKNIKQTVITPNAGSRPSYNFLLLGLDRPDEEIKKLIMNRLIDRLEKEDMVAEVRRLNKEGVSWLRLDSFGLEYRFIGAYLQEKLTYEEMVEKLAIAIYRFSKRQKTWFRRWERQGQKINWLSNYQEAEDELKKWLADKYI